MGVEQLRGVIPTNEFFPSILGRVKESRRRGFSADRVLADIFGEEVIKGFMYVEKRLKEEYGGTLPDNLALFPHPNNHLFNLLKEDEQKSFALDYAGGWLASMVPVIETAEENSKFSMAMCRVRFGQIKAGTHVFSPQVPGDSIVDRELVRRLREGRTIFTGRGLYSLQPNLPKFFEDWGVIQPLTKTVGPAYTSLLMHIDREMDEAQLPKVVFDRDKWDFLWDRAVEKESGEKPK